MHRPQLLRCKSLSACLAAKPELVQISTAYGGQKEGSTVLPRNKYTAIRDDKPTSKDDAKRPEFKVCKFTTEAIANTTGLRVLAAVGAAVPVRLLKRDLLFILEKLVSIMDENRVETLARQHGIRQKRDDGGIGKTLTAFVRRADEGTLSRLLVEATILLASSRNNPTVILKEAATAYKVDTEAIAVKVKQEFATKEKAKKAVQAAPKTAKKAA